MDLKWILTNGVEKLYKYVITTASDVVVARSAEEPFAPSQSIFPRHEIEIGRLYPAQLACLARDLNHGRADLESRFENSLALVARLNERFVGFVWMTTAARVAEGVAPFLYPIHPKPKSAYVYDLYVTPDFRGGGVGCCLIKAITEFAYVVENESVFFTFDALDESMRRISQKLGFREVGPIAYRSFLGRARMDLSNLQVVST